MTCYACDNDPVQQCARCGRPFCEDHGEEFCAVCLHPSSGVPSFNLYRGSLLALLVGTALAVWLIIQPAGGESEAGTRPRILTPTTVAGAGRVGTLAANTTPGLSTIVVPGTTGTPGVQTTPRPTSTTTPTAGSTEYTVLSGDTLSGICEKTKPASMSINDCIEQIKRLNNLTNENELSIGQRLRVPR